jgi:hypothetical protein
MKPSGVLEALRGISDQCSWRSSNRKGVGYLAMEALGSSVSVESGFGCHFPCRSRWFGGTELNCGDLAPHVEAGCLYAVPAEWSIPRSVTWPSAQRRNPLPAQAHRARGRSAPRPGAQSIFLIS